jgi:hypothetical protein
VGRLAKLGVHPHFGELRIIERLQETTQDGFFAQPQGLLDENIRKKAVRDAALASAALPVPPVGYKRIRRNRRPIVVSGMALTTEEARKRHKNVKKRLKPNALPDCEAADGEEDDGIIPAPLPEMSESSESDAELEEDPQSEQGAEFDACKKGSFCVMAENFSSGAAGISMGKVCAPVCCSCCSCCSCCTCCTCCSCCSCVCVCCSWYCPPGVADPLGE